MKRRYASRARKGLALGSIAVAGVGLTACGDNFEGNYSFKSVDECARAGFDRAVCEAEFQTALNKHASDAPRFTTEQLCEAQFGTNRCQQYVQPNGGGSFFVPFLTGYLVSSALRDFSYSRYQNYRVSNTGYSPTPIYRDRTGRTVRTAREGGRTVTKPVNRNTRTASRSGFGGRGWGRSSSRGWGG